MRHAFARSGVAALGALLQTAAVGVVIGVAADAATPAPVVDPDVRAQVAAGRVRVIVELRVTSREDPAAIASVQTRVIDALPVSHAVLARRYTSVPALALEIDAEGLRALERLSDTVIRVRADAVKRTQ